ncbi:FAD-dependent monooxygenase [Saprospira sp. CCB-QB6]|uniref:NAD(P)/FAD-dependent oxidoreductase n=1 Tax=Saprospira sp. CCB-QB6 TaxID=3023936 RepID=UPI00234B0038|nr:FAD-dependent monooxygenase [Saprospira sp. CCB-QB6]WCL82693.1 FAD-dependent monooxygenase [Saprospira sp. CCB-QB6]
MPQEVEISILPQELEQDALIEKKLRKKLRWPKDQQLAHWHVRRKSLDARGRQPLFRLRIVAYKAGEVVPETPSIIAALPQVQDRPKVLIVGAGPAGYFAALELIELGLKPIILERGKDVQARRRDLRAIQQFGEVNPHSNYCFGEGGAGTYSDGKLYTRAKKRGSIEKSLRLFVEHGAPSDILVDAHPHIGSNKLPKVVAAMRETIESKGGEIHFGAWVTDFLIEEKQGQRTLKGLRTADGQEWWGQGVILATGHSARDIFRLLDQKKVAIEAKPFALGVRIEHPQALIDELQYGIKERPKELPASSYSLVCQVENRGVFSFCMCPGGLIVPASTAPGELVVNGMSMSRRDSPFANSGMVVAVDMEDLKEYAHLGPFAAMSFQQEVEQALFQAGDGSQAAPAQRLTDFVKGKPSSSLPKTSYIPGIYSARLDQLLPAGISRRLQQGLQQMGKKMRGYYTEEAQLIGVESRTSSPIRIPRESDNCMHPELQALFPCGEGAGYAGGIISAAMDGQKVAQALAKWIAVQ